MGNLVGIFQPAKSTGRLHGPLSAAIEKPTSTVGKVAKCLEILMHLIAAALSRYVWAPFLAIAPGVALLWVLDWAPRWHWLMGIGIVVPAAAMLAALVGLATEPEPPAHLRCVLQRERDRQPKQWDDARNQRLARTVLLCGPVLAGVAALVLVFNAADGVQVALGAAFAGLAIDLGLLEEGEPAGAVFGGGNVTTEDLTVTLTIDADREQAGDVDDAPPFTHSHGQGVAHTYEYGPRSRGRLRKSAAISSRSLVRFETWDFENDSIPSGAHQRLGEATHHLAPQISVGRLEMLAQPRQRVHAPFDHRVPPHGRSHTYL